MILSLSVSVSLCLGLSLIFGCIIQLQSIPLLFFPVGIPARYDVKDLRSTHCFDQKCVYSEVKVSCPPQGVQWPHRQLCSHRPGGYSETGAGEFTQVEGGAEGTP